MNENNYFSRRGLVKSSIFGFLAVSIPNSAFSKNIEGLLEDKYEQVPLFYRYPAIADAIVAEVVGVSHFNLERLKELVNHRPELARATWDWAFGDWETAIGAASHVGRRDIAAYLMSKGARPDIFTYAMLGAHDAVKTMIEASPGIQTTGGPHGISLLQHAKNGLRSDGITDSQKQDSAKLVSYLEGLGNADVAEKFIDINTAEKEKYLGDYKYGEGPEDGFSIKLNMKKFISLGKLGKFGGGLYKKSENVFIYNGTSSVQISFSFENGKVVSLTITEPDLIITAKKI